MIIRFRDYRRNLRAPSFSRMKKTCYKRKAQRPIMQKVRHKLAANFYGLSDFSLPKVLFHRSLTVLCTIDDFAFFRIGGGTPLKKQFLTVTFMLLKYRGVKPKFLIFKR